LVHFAFIWHIFSGFGIMRQEGSGNPGAELLSDGLARKITKHVSQDLVSKGRGGGGGGIIQSLSNKAKKDKLRDRAAAGEQGDQIGRNFAHWVTV
jgi:hypothetical protein